MNKLEKKLKALADPNRLRIIALLFHNRLCVCELAAVLKITQPSVSKHLKKLKDADLIDSEQDGLWTNYFLLKQTTKTDQKLISAVIANLLELPEIKSDIKKSTKINREQICSSI